MSSKTQLAGSPTSAKTAPMPTVAPTQEEIAARAYELFLQSGSVDGHHMEHWLRAEAELKAQKKT